MTDNADSQFLNKLMPLLACVLPVSAVRLEDESGELLHNWNHNSMETSELSKFIWHDLGSDAGRLGVGWCGIEPPSTEETQLLNTLGLQLAQSWVANSHTGDDLRSQDLLSRISHDLRSPLTSIISATELVKINPEFLEDSRFIEKIGEKAHHALNLVDGYLQLVTADNADPSSFQTVNLTDVMTRAGEALLEKVASDRVSIEYVHYQPVYVHGDANLLEQVFSNLLDNAIKFSPDGGTVTLGTQRSSGEAISWIQDDGYGIKEAEIPKLFERYERNRPKQDQQQRPCGLGLVFIKTVVEQHQGKVWVDSVINQGSRFSFSMPALEVSESAGL